MKNSLLLLVVLLTTGSCTIMNASKNPQRKFGLIANAMAKTRNQAPATTTTESTREQRIAQERAASRVLTRDEQLDSLGLALAQLNLIEQRHRGSSSQTSS